VDKTRLAKATVDAFARASQDKIEACRVAADDRVSKSVRLAVKPPKAASSLRKAGVVLVLAPDPVTAVPGVAMIGASYAIKKKEAAGLEELIEEARRVASDLESLL
jgi:hypothetical protein